MKKCLSFAFAVALAVTSMLAPVHAQEVSQVDTTQAREDVLQGSLNSLSKSTDTFFALSLLSTGVSEEKMKEMETTFLSQAQKMATSARSSAQDVEKLILLVEGFGYDATAFELDGKTTNLFDLLATKSFALVNDYTFALEALQSAGYTSTKEVLSKDAMLNQLLSMRNTKDNAWNYNADYSGEWGSSDADTTAMVLTALAPYALNSASSMGISEATKAAVSQASKDGFAYLSGKQSATGAIDNFGENACSTSMVILALRAHGLDIQQTAQFVKNGKTLEDGLMSFATADHTGFISNYTFAYDEFTTEQAVRALLALKQTASPFALYQAGAVLNQNRFKVETPTQPEVTPPMEEPKKEEIKKEEPIIKNTGSQDTSWIWMASLLSVAVYGAYTIRKKA